jgi:hypothetical protein
MNDVLKRCGKKQYWPISKYYLSSPGGLEENHETPVRIFGIPAEFQSSNEVK